MPRLTSNDILPTNATHRIVIAVYQTSIFSQKIKCYRPELDSHLVFCSTKLLPLQQLLNDIPEVKSYIYIYVKEFTVNIFKGGILMAHCHLYEIYLCNEADSLCHQCFCSLGFQVAFWGEKVDQWSIVSVPWEACVQAEWHTIVLRYLFFISILSYTESHNFHQKVDASKVTVICWLFLHFTILKLKAGNF